MRLLATASPSWGPGAPERAIGRDTVSAAEPPDGELAVFRRTSIPRRGQLFRVRADGLEVFGIEIPWSKVRRLEFLERRMGGWRAIPFVRLELDDLTPWRPEGDNLLVRAGLALQRFQGIAESELPLSGWDAPAGEIEAAVERSFLAYAATHLTPAETATVLGELAPSDWGGQRPPLAVMLRNLPFVAAGALVVWWSVSSGADRSFVAAGAALIWFGGRVALPATAAWLRGTDLRR